jgi:WD domain, G-beta repeat
MQFDPCCPLCRKKLKFEDIHSNLALNCLVAELVVYCPCKIDGCTETMRFEEVTNHISNNCLFASKKCVYHNYGCQFAGIDLKQHLTTCSYHKLRAFIKTCDQRISHLETIVMEQQQVISHFLAGAIPAPVTITSPNPIIGGSLGNGNSSDISPATEELRVAEHNWLEAGMSNTKTIIAEKSGITSLIYADSGKLYAGSYDGSIKVFDYYSGSVTKLLQSHRLSVWALALDSAKDRIYSGCSDEIINVWGTNSNSTSPIGSFAGNRGKVYSLQIKDERLFSASSDNIIRIWNCNTMELVGTLVGHSAGVNSIKFHENYLISASSDKSIKVTR